MRLNLNNIIHVPGASLPFSFSADLSAEEFYGETPITDPLEVTGVVRNMAGALVLNAQAVTTLNLHCDRCTKPFRREKQVSLETLLATELENEEDSDIELLDGDELDVGELMTTAFILDMDTKNLCTPDCKGLCPGCGADLNVEECHCKREIDPRLAKLASLLE
ncbi:MAG: DUF177 domain-containing protein [Oscillospiraceae bacterium]